jgi:hypothetical protein
MLLIRGPPGSSVSLSIHRDSKLLQFSVPRDVEILSVGASPISSPAVPAPSDRDEDDKEHIRRLLSSRMPRPVGDLLGSDYGRPLSLDGDNPAHAGNGLGSRPSSNAGSQRSSRGASGSCTDPLGQCQPPAPPAASVRRPASKRESTAAAGRRTSAAAAAAAAGSGRSSLVSVRTDASSPQTFIFDSEPGRRGSSTPPAPDGGAAWPGPDERLPRPRPTDLPAPGPGGGPWKDGCGDVGCHRLCPAAALDDTRRLCPLPSIMMGWPTVQQPPPAAAGGGRPSAAGSPSL